MTEIKQFRAELAAMTAERDRYKDVAETHASAMQELIKVREELAAAQATNERLREALEQVAEEKARGYHEIRSIALDVLALPNDTTALDARLKEEREKVIEWIKNNYQDHTLDGICYAIRSMT
jgi:uncharacterized protein (DUF3084 family)